MTPHPLTDELPELWRRAVRAPFLDAVRDGSLPPEAFDRWLAQDALSVADLLRFQARLLARAPRPAQAVLAAGAPPLVDELAWFEGQAGARGLDLAADPLPVTRDDSGLLTRLDAAPWATALTALWVLARVDLLAGGGAAGAGQPYAPFVDHWTAPGFAEYVAGLEQAAVAALGEVDGDDLRRACAEVLELEAASWGAGAAA